METKNIILQFIYRVAVNCIGLGLASFIFMHLQVEDFLVLFAAAVILTILNFLVKPLLLFISLPVMFFTMGIAYFVINGIMILMVSWFVQGFQVEGLWTAIGVSLIVSLVNLMFDFFANVNVERLDK